MCMIFCNSFKIINFYTFNYNWFVYNNGKLCPSISSCCVNCYIMTNCTRFSANEEITTIVPP